MPVTITYNLLLKAQPMSGNDVSESEELLWSSNRHTYVILRSFDEK